MRKYTKKFLKEWYIENMRLMDEGEIDFETATAINSLLPPAYVAVFTDKKTVKSDNSVDYDETQRILEYVGS